MNTALVVGMALALAPALAFADVRHTFGSTDERPYESVNQSPRVLDPEKSEQVRGTITTLNQVMMEDNVPFTQARVRTEQAEVTVHLAPEWYLTQHIEHFELVPKQKVEVRGSRQTIQGREVLVAEEIRAQDGDQRLRLRHKDGTPVWSAGEKIKK